MYPTLTYYERIDAKSASPTRGGIYWTWFQFAYSYPKVERVHRDRRPIEDLVLENFDPSSNSADTTDQTRNTEFLAVQKFKHRPVVVLSSTGNAYLESVQKRWKGGQHVLVAPLYSVWDETTKRFNFESKFLLQTIRYDYPSAFFLPGSRTFDMVAGIARLEYAQAIHVSWLQKFGRGVKLTAPALQFLEEWFIRFTTETVSDAFAKELRDFRAYLDQEGNVEINTTRFPDGLYDD